MTSQLVLNNNCASFMSADNALKSSPVLFPLVPPKLISEIDFFFSCPLRTTSANEDGRAAKDVRMIRRIYRSFPLLLLLPFSLNSAVRPSNFFANLLDGRIQRARDGPNRHRQRRVDRFLSN